MPGGGVACPNSSSPQQTTVPSGRTPQVWDSPALTEAMRRPVDWPK